MHISSGAALVVTAAIFVAQLLIVTPIILHGRSTFVKPTVFSSHPSSPARQPSLASSVSIRAALSDRGDFTDKRYLFRNVYLQGRDSLAVYLPSDKFPTLPTRPLICNVVHINVTTTQLPTTFYAKTGNTAEMTLHVAYNHTPSARAQQQKTFKMECRRWERRPVYLLTTPWPENTWHVFNDALLGAFQTLREEGLLPLAKINGNGSVEELTAGLDLEGCPWVFDVGGSEPYRAKRCRTKFGAVVAAQKCRISDIYDCPAGGGVVPVRRRDRSGTPILLLAKSSLPPPEKWAHYFRAVSPDIRNWSSMVGTCFKELYVGRSNTLNLYVANNNNVQSGRAARPTLQLRREALETLRALLRTAEGQKLQEKGALEVPWAGYPNVKLERLRRGIGPNKVAQLEVLRRLRRQQIKAEGSLKREDREEMLRVMDAREGRQLVAAKARKKKAGSVGEGGDAWHRPVVTWIWRSMLSRAVLNEADVLEFILSRYNVTVRVTAFEEPMLEVMALMADTDVLLGMHGAGWTNGIFLKPGAAALQLYPYGWALEGAGVNGSLKTVRGDYFGTMVSILGGVYAEWVNPHSSHAFIRREDYDDLWPWLGKDASEATFQYALHPQPHWQTPVDWEPEIHWVYQNTVVNVTDFAPVLDGLMRAKGILPLQSGSAVHTYIKGF